jgi:hypothetical protein
MRKMGGLRVVFGGAGRSPSSTALRLPGGGKVLFASPKGAQPVYLALMENASASSRDAERPCKPPGA